MYAIVLSDTIHFSLYTSLQLSLCHVLYAHRMTGRDHVSTGKTFVHYFTNIFFYSNLLFGLTGIFTPVFSQAECLKN